MNRKYNIYILLLLALTAVSFVSSICIGRYSIRLDVILDIIFNNSQNASKLDFNIIINSRLPRSLVACFSGIALSLSGLLYQNIFNNKLVSPDLLGAASGASVGACFAIILGCSKTTITACAFVFGILAVGITLFLSKLFNNNSTVMILLSGIVVTGLMDAIVGLTKYLADNEGTLAEITFWLMGDISKSNIRDLYILIPIVSTIALLIHSIRWKINIIALGEYEAKSLGMNYVAMRYLLLACATLLTASVVAVAGTIAWVGLVVPHMSRLLVGNNNKQSIPISILIGATFMMIVDLLARTLSYSEIPLSIITGFLGTPIFILILFLRRNDF